MDQRGRLNYRSCRPRSARAAFNGDHLIHCEHNSSPARERVAPVAGEHVFDDEDVALEPGSCEGKVIDHFSDVAEVAEVDLAAVGEADVKPGPVLFRRR